MIKKVRYAIELDLNWLRRFFPAFLIIVSLALFFVNLQKGIAEVRIYQDKVDSFLKIQELNFTFTPNYTVYSKEGISTLFIQSPAGALNRSSLLPDDVMSKVDSVAVLKLLNNIKGKSLRYNKNFLSMDYSEIFNLLIAILSFAYGCTLLYPRFYLRAIHSVWSDFTLYRILARLIILFAYVLAIYGLAVLLYFLNGVDLNRGDWLGIMGIMTSTFIHLCFFFMGGMITRIIFNKRKLFVIAVSALLFISFIYPYIVGLISEDKLPDTITDYRSELNQLMIIRDFEKRAKDRYVKISPETMPLIKELFKEFINIDLKKLENEEIALKNRFIRYFRINNLLYMFTPTTFHQATLMEASSKGSKSFIDFYGNAQQLKRDFLMFYINEVTKPKPLKVKNFVTGNQNIFRATASLPDYFFLGVTVNALYIVLLIVLALKLSAQYLVDSSPDKIKLIQVSPIFIMGGSVGAVYTMPYMRLGEKLYRILKGFSLPENTPMEVKVGAVDHPQRGGHDDFCYIPHPDHLPDEETPATLVLALAGSNRLDESEIDAMRQGDDAIDFNKKFGFMDPLEKADFLRRLMRAINTRLFLVDRIGDDLPPTFVLSLNHTFRELAARMIGVIYLTKQKEMSKGIKINTSVNTFGMIASWSEYWNSLKEAMEMENECKKNLNEDKG